MKDIFILLVHLLTTLAKLLGPGGTKAVIAEYLLLKQQLLVVTRSRRRAPNFSAKGPSWLTLIGHSKDSLWSIDLFRCESILLKTHWVLVVMDQFTRRIIGFGVHAGDVYGVALCRMFNKAISTMRVPHYLSSDNDPLFTYHRWKANLRVPAVISGDPQPLRAKLSNYSWVPHCNGFF